MHITRFEFNRTRRETAILLKDRQRLHAIIESSFPPGTPPTSGRLLWRIDKTAHSHALIIVSPTPPDLTGLSETAGWPVSGSTGWETKNYTPRLNATSEGSQWAFQLVATPTRSVRPESNPRGRGKRVPITRQADKIAWLERKADTAGFTINPDSVLATPTDALSFTKKNASNLVTLTPTQFQGYLTVTDPTTFQHALTHGIGAAKGYGLGLLTISPI